MSYKLLHEALAKKDCSTAQLRHILHVKIKMNKVNLYYVKLCAITNLSYIRLWYIFDFKVNRATKIDTAIICIPNTTS